MAEGRLYIFVEGNDDERFFEAVIVPLFKKYYKEVEILKYAQWKKKKVNLFMQSIETLGFEYIFTRDIDDAATLGAKIREMLERYEQLDCKTITIVISEIESWYLAGLNKKSSMEMRIEYFTDTEPIVKEDFNLVYRSRYRSRIDFMREILKRFSTTEAAQKNKSFKFFITKYSLA